MIEERVLCVPPPPSTVQKLQVAPSADGNQARLTGGRKPDTINRT